MDMTGMGDIASLMKGLSGLSIYVAMANSSLAYLTV